MIKIRDTYFHLLAKIITPIILFSACLFSVPAMADGCKPTNCPTTCSASSSSTCGKTFDAGCIVKQNEQTEGGTCFNNVPVSGASSVSSQCSSSSSNGESGTNFPVTNSSPTDTTIAKAAAKGKVIFAGVTEDGGRTVIIEHTKGCNDSGHGDTGKYHTIYRHLQSISVTEGSEVDINTQIGIVGGSTANEAKSLCDNSAQSSLPGYTTSGCGSTKSEDLHLNFEVIDGPASGSNGNASSSAALNSNCSEIQNMCGSCSSDVSTCISESPAEYREINTSSTAVDNTDKNTKTSANASCAATLDFDPNSCVFCGLFKDIFNAASSIAKIANDGLSIPTRNIVGIAFLIWLAIFVLRQISSFGAIKIPDMLKGILFQGFRVTVVMLILGGALYQVMDLTINPILQTGLSFSRSFSETTTCPSDAEYLKNIVGYDANKGIQKNSTGGLSVQVGTAFICSIKKLEDNVSGLLSYGNYSICLSFKDFPALGIIPHAGFLTTGAFLYIVGAVLMLMFPWFLIDCMLQLCLTVALLPCAIGSFAFKSTAKYMKTLWNFFMNSMFNFVFIAIIIFIITANFKAWLGYDFRDNNIDPNIFINATGNGLAWWGTTAFRILGICFFCFVFLDEAKSMAGKFAEGATLGGGEGIGTMFGGLAASTGYMATAFGAKKAGDFGSKMAESAESWMGVSARSKTNQAKAVYAKLTGGKKIVDDNGNTIGYEKTSRLFGKEYKSVYTKDENGIWSRSTTSKDKTKINDAVMEVTLSHNAAGEVTGIKTKADNTASKYFTNKDGTVNAQAVDTLMNNVQNKEYAARHIMSSVMQERGMQLDDKFLSSKTTINEDGSWTIVQKNEDGTLQTVNASLDRNTGVMTINSKFDDGSGKIKNVTSTGFNTRTTTSQKAETRPSDNRAPTHGPSEKVTTNASSTATEREPANEQPQQQQTDKDSSEGSSPANASGVKGKNISQQHMDRINQLLNSGKLSLENVNEIIDKIDEGMSDSAVNEIINEYIIS